MLGPASQEIVAAWGAEEVTKLSAGCHTTMAFQGSPVVVFNSSGLGTGVPGWTVIVGEDAAAEFFRKVALQVREQCMLSMHAERTTIDGHPSRNVHMCFWPHCTSKELLSTSDSLESLSL